MKCLNEIVNESRKFDHPFNTTACKARALKEYKAHDGLIVAFDYDNTIFDFHGDGGNYNCVIDLLKEASECGCTLVMFSTEQDEKNFEPKKKYCEELGIKVDYINESPLFQGSKKPYYNILLDDRAGLESAYEVLRYVIDNVKKDK